MRLAARLVLAFGFVATLSVAGLGYSVREDRRHTETQRFDHEVQSACDRAAAEIRRQAASDHKLIAGACQSGELVDRTAIWLEAGTLDDPTRLALSRIVPEERQAFDLDELILATADGDLLAEDPIALLKMPRADIVTLVGGDVDHFTLRPLPRAAIVSRCRKAVRGGTVGLIGSRRLAPLVERLGRTIDAQVTLGPALAAQDDVARASCTLSDAAGTRLTLTVSKPRKELNDNLARIDQNVFYAGLIFTGFALLIAVGLARNLGRPIADLASEARKVASGEARPLAVRGPAEIRELAQAFDKMLVDLEATRRRLAAASRVAAWREVARRVAHEVKNPLAPIRAAVETLRRLRARNDPEFDAYFDEATRTVLDEVHRISTIVSEFTRFARLPAPHPQQVDLVDLTRQVARLHEAGSRARLRVDVEPPPPPPVRADRDQIVQVLTNLLQNALDAVADQGEAGEIRMVVGSEGAAHVAITFHDSGPGVPSAIAERLFEPYATTKPQGTGLGLAIAQRIAMEHDGELSYIAPSPGSASGAAPQGGSFRLVLPVRGPHRGSEGTPVGGV